MGRRWGGERRVGKLTTEEHANAAVNAMHFTDRLLQAFLEKGLGAPPDVTFFLGDRVREWAPYVRIETRALWAAEPRRRRFAAVLRGKWNPDAIISQDQAIKTYREQIFGPDD